MDLKTGARSFILSACVAALTMILAGCSFDYGKEAPGGPEVPDAVFRDLVREEIGNGRLEFRARAAKAEYYAAEGKFVVEGLSFEDLDPATGKVLRSGEADRAVYHEDNDNAEFSGRIRLRSAEEDAVFETESLNYRGATKTIEGAREDSLVVRVGETFFMRGRGFFADVDAGLFAFRGGVDGTIKDK